MADSPDKDKKNKGKGAQPDTGIQADRVRELADLLSETGLDEIEYAADDWRVRVVRRGGAAPAGVSVAVPSAAPTAAAPAVVAAESIADHPGIVKSPMVGMVYTSPDPATPPFVRVGDAIAEGQTLVLIEAMKVFNPIKAPRAGKLTRMFVANGTPVEYGEPLVLIE